MLNAKPIPWVRLLANSSMETRFERARGKCFSIRTIGDYGGIFATANRRVPGIKAANAITIVRDRSVSRRST
jgi:hypothetical protein